MEPYLLHLFLTFVAGLAVGIIVMLLINKLKTGKLSPASVKQEYQEYQEQVEEHFEQTSKKFKDMTEQYQDLYQHLSVGATSLCRPDSVAASLADESQALKGLEQKEAGEQATSDNDEVKEKLQANTLEAETEKTSNSNGAGDPQTDDTQQDSKASQSEGINNQDKPNQAQVDAKSAS